MDKVREALLSLEEGSLAEVEGQRLRVLENALLTGFEVVGLEAYEVIHRWAKLAKMPPYEEL